MARRSYRWRLTMTVSNDRDSFRVVFLTDIHFGASHLDSNELKCKLEEFLYPVLRSGIDVLVIGGDFFDNAIVLDTTTAKRSIECLKDFIQLSVEYNFAIRAIRGTYTHDRNQLGIITSLATNRSFRKECVKPDVKYFDDIAVDVVKGYSFLFMPDNLPYRNLSEACAKARFEIEERNLAQADFMVGHGYFKHVLPDVIKDCTEAYTEEMVRPLVKRCVMMGHVHTSSVYDDFIYYGGSFDRMAHGEEETKGFFTFTVTGDILVPEFVTNLEAVPHYTVYLNNSEDVDVNIRMVDDFIEKRFPVPMPQGYLRIAGHELRKQVMSFVIAKYPCLVVTDMDTAMVKKIEGTKNRLDVRMIDYKGFEITPDNLPDLVVKALKKYRKDTDDPRYDIDRKAVIDCLDSLAKGELS